MTQPPGFSILPITENDTHRVLEFLNTFFFRDEPLVECLKIMVEPDSRCPELEEFSVNSIPDGFSIMAVNASGGVIGVCLNGLLSREHHSLEPPAAERHLELEKCLDLKFRKIVKLLDSVYWETNPFTSHAEVNTVLDVKIVSVDSVCRRQGIAKALVTRSIEIAQEKKIPLVRVDCTSAFSSRVMERVGFRRVYSLPYADYTDSEGQPIFSPKPPHFGVASFLYIVEEDGH